MFVQGTVVKTEDGSICVDDLRVGSVVLGPAGARTVVSCWSTVSEIYRLFLFGERAIYCSADQPFLVDGSWRAADELGGVYVGESGAEHDAEQADMFGFCVAGQDSRIFLQDGQIAYCGG